MKTWMTFLLLVAVACQTVASDKGPPDSAKGTSSPGQRRNCAPLTNVTVIKAAKKEIPYTEHENATCDTAEAVPKEESNDSKTQGEAIDGIQDGRPAGAKPGNQEGHGKREDSAHVEQQEEKPMDQLPARDSQNTTDQRHHNTTTELLSEEDKQEPTEDAAAISLNQTNGEAAAHSEAVPQPTEAATTEKPVTTQEPTTVTTQDPNYCRREGFVKPWPECNRKVDQGDKNLEDGLTKFSLGLFHQILGEKPEGNVVFSPLSLAMVLSHLLLGARGDTKDLLLQSLFDIKDSNFSDCLHTMLRKTIVSQGFESASTMFIHQDLHMNRFFFDQSDILYGIKPETLGNSTDDNLQRINDWVAKNTRRKIKKILDDLDESVRLVLLNTIFFQGKWITKFSPSKTRAQEFGQPPVKVKMMLHDKYPLTSVNDPILRARIARFPLSDSMSMLILLPQFPQIPLSELVQKLNLEVFQAMLSKLEKSHSNPAIVALPKFKVASTQDLVKVFSSSGLADLLSQPNLCGISDSEGLAVSGGQHRAVLQMDEAGVVAAAATAVTLARTVYVFEVRHPFLFMVWSDVGRIPVMMGRITDPSA